MFSFPRLEVNWPRSQAPSGSRLRTAPVPVTVVHRGAQHVTEVGQKGLQDHADAVHPKAPLTSPMNAPSQENSTDQAVPCISLDYRRPPRNAMETVGAAESREVKGSMPTQTMVMPPWTTPSGMHRRKRTDGASSDHMRQEGNNDANRPTIRDALLLLLDAYNAETEDCGRVRLRAKMRCTMKEYGYHIRQGQAETENGDACMAGTKLQSAPTDDTSRPPNTDRNLEDIFDDSKFLPAHDSNALEKENNSGDHQKVYAPGDAHLPYPSMRAAHGFGHDSACASLRPARNFAHIQGGAIACGPSMLRDVDKERRKSSFELLRNSPRVQSSDAVHLFPSDARKIQVVHQEKQTPSRTSYFTPHRARRAQFTVTLSPVAEEESLTETPNGRKDEPSATSLIDYIISPAFAQASGRKRRESVQKLLHSQADIHASLPDGTTTLALCAMRNYEYCVRELLRARADVDRMDRWNVSPLLKATVSSVCSIRLVKILIAARATVNSADVSLRTPLHYAAMASGPRAAQVAVALLEAKADPSLRSVDGQTVDECAVSDPKFLHGKYATLASALSVGPKGMTAFMATCARGSCGDVRAMFRLFGYTYLATTDAYGLNAVSYAVYFRRSRIEWFLGEKGFAEVPDARTKKVKGWRTHVERLRATLGAPTILRPKTDILKRKTRMLENVEAEHRERLRHLEDRLEHIKFEYFAKRRILRVDFTRRVRQQVHRIAHAHLFSCRSQCRLHPGELTS